MPLTLDRLSWLCPIALLSVLIGCGAANQREPAPFRPVTIEDADAHDPSLSPDGSLVVYTSDRAEAGNGDIWVQPVTGGSPKRLTSNPANDYDGVFSRDSQWVYFTSLREPQGIYRVSVSGGDAGSELVARGGVAPRISPGGQTLLFGSQANVAVMNLADRSSRSLVPDFDNSFSAVWAPQGDDIMFAGRRTKEEPVGWWTMNTNGTGLVRTTVLDSLKQAGFSEAFLQAWLPGDQLIFAGKKSDQITLYRCSISADHSKLSSAPVRATDSDSGDFHASYAAGYLVFDRIQTTLNQWSLPADANQGRVTGTLQRLTSTLAQKGNASLSADGTKLLYSTEERGAYHLLFKNLSDGKEKKVGPDATFFSMLSPDGTLFAYGSGPNENLTLSRRAVRGWRSWWSRTICSGCGMPRGFTADGRFLLTWTNNNPGNHIDLVEVASGKPRIIVSDTGQRLYGPELSPDGKWISFVAGAGQNTFTSYVVRIPQDGPAIPADWVSVNPSSSNFQMVFWSPDGNLLYLLDSHGEGNLNWLDAVRLDSRTKRPESELLHVHHFQSPRVPTMDPIWNRPAAANGRIMLQLGDSSSNIWITNAPAP